MVLKKTTLFRQIKLFFQNSLITVLRFIISDPVGQYLIVGLYILIIYSISHFLLFTVFDDINLSKLRALSLVYYLYYLFSLLFWWSAFIRPLLKFLVFNWFMMDYQRKELLVDFFVFFFACAFVAWVFFAISSIVAYSYFFLESYVDVEEFTSSHKKIVAMSPQRPPHIITPHISFGGISVDDKPVVPVEGPVQVSLSYIVQAPLICKILLFKDHETGQNIPVFLVGIPKACLGAVVDLGVLTRPVESTTVLGTLQTLFLSCLINVVPHLPRKLGPDDFYFMLVSAEYSEPHKGTVQQGVDFFLHGNPDWGGSVAGQRTSFIGSPVCSKWIGWGEACFYSPIKGNVLLSQLPLKDQHDILNHMRMFTEEHIREFNKLPKAVRIEQIQQSLIGGCKDMIPPSVWNGLPETPIQSQSPSSSISSSSSSENDLVLENDLEKSSRELADSVQAAEERRREILKQDMVPGQDPLQEMLNSFEAKKDTAGGAARSDVDMLTPPVASEVGYRSEGSRSYNLIDRTITRR